MTNNNKIRKQLKAPEDYYLEDEENDQTKIDEWIEDMKRRKIKNFFCTK